jgi:dTDP-4-dehydrorhamnose reductase
VWHYAGLGATTWFGFARALADELGLAVDLAPIPATAWPERARRPRRAVLDTGRIRALGVPALAPRPWRDALQFLSR